MPIHDWTRVSAATFHDFHSSWIVHLKETLNSGLLPSSYYAMAEQRTRDVWPDVLTLESRENRHDASGGDDWLAGTLAVAEHPPQVQWSAESEMAYYLQRQRSLVIRHASGDRVVAILEIVSPANKASHGTVEAFLDKSISVLYQGYHLLVIDLHPPGAHDPHGIHGALWSELGEPAYELPSDTPLTLAAYAAGEGVKAFVEPTRVGSPLPEMPLFLTSERYIRAPLESTYMAAWRGVPQRWRQVIAPDEH
jgi:hypothetical protein